MSKGILGNDVVVEAGASGVLYEDSAGELDGGIAGEYADVVGPLAAAVKRKLMDAFKAFPCLQAALLIFAVVSVNGQISTPCTASMISSFTPCLNFITGSTGNGVSPTAACCNSLKSLMSTSMDCTCLIVTGSVPFSLPASTQLAISLPRACKTNLPVQCKASGVPLPAPGPVLFAPNPPPVAASPLSPRASKATALAPVQAPAETTIATPEASPSAQSLAPTATATPAQLAPTATGIRPVLTPASASNPSSLPSSLLPILAAVMISKFY